MHTSQPALLAHLPCPARSARPPTCRPHVSRILLVLDDEVEDVATVVTPLVQFEADVRRVGCDEVLALGGTRRTASQRPRRQNLFERSHLR